MLIKLVAAFQFLHCCFVFDLVFLFCWVFQLFFSIHSVCKVWFSLSCGQYSLLEQKYTVTLARIELYFGLSFPMKQCWALESLLPKWHKMAEPMPCLGLLSGPKHLQVAERKRKKWLHAINIKECWQIHLGTKDSISDDSSHRDWQLDEYDTRKTINLRLVDSPNALPTAVPTSPKCEIQVQCVCLCVVCFMDPHILYSFVITRPFTEFCNH